MTAVDYSWVNAWNASGTLVPYTAEQLASRGWIRRAPDDSRWIVTQAGRKAGLR